MENRPSKHTEKRRFRLPVNYPDRAEFCGFFGPDQENEPNFDAGGAVFWKTFGRPSVRRPFASRTTPLNGASSR